MIGNEDIAVKLVETEDLLEATQAEKENLDAQVQDFSHHNYCKGGQ